MTSHHITSSERTQVSLETIQWNRPDAKRIVFFPLLPVGFHGGGWCKVVCDRVFRGGSDRDLLGADWWWYGWSEKGLARSPLNRRWEYNNRPVLYVRKRQWQEIVCARGFFVVVIPPFQYSRDCHWRVARNETWFTWIFVEFRYWPSLLCHHYYTSSSLPSRNQCDHYLWRFTILNRIFARTRRPWVLD